MTIVFHAAGYYPDKDTPVDLALAEARRQTEHVIRAVEKNPSIRKLVFASTLTTIGPAHRSGEMADETCEFQTTFLDNPYLMAKHAMEQSVLAAVTRGLPAVVVNPTVFYGPFDSKPSTGRHILTIAKRMMPAYIQRPVNVIDVRDVAKGMIRAAEVGRVGERYILGNWNTTHQEVNELIARVAGVMPPLVAVPYSVARTASKLGELGFQTLLRRQAPLPSFLVEMLAHIQHYDCSKAIEELGYPRSPVEQAIRDALSWFSNNGYL
jgi:dihydroflavonol-4-reductase